MKSHHLLPLPSPRPSTARTPQSSHFHHHLPLLPLHPGSPSTRLHHRLLSPLSCSHCPPRTAYPTSWCRSRSGREPAAANKMHHPLLMSLMSLRRHHRHHRRSCPLLPLKSWGHCCYFAPDRSLGAARGPLCSTGLGLSPVERCHVSGRSCFRHGGARWQGCGWESIGLECGRCWIRTLRPIPQSCRSSCCLRLIRSTHLQVGSLLRLPCRILAVYPRLELRPACTNLKLRGLGS
jgi:hypothetical protein